MLVRRTALAGLLLAVSITAGSSTAPVSATPTSAAMTTGASAFTAMAPTRILDTRTTGGAIDDDSTLDLAVAGAPGVPATGVTAVIMNVTVTNSTGPGYLTVWPAGDARPTVSNVNTTGPGETVANLVVVKVPASGHLSIFSQRRADVVVDVTGFFTAAGTGSVRGGRLMPVTPARVLDTRQSGAPLAPGDSMVLPMTGRGGVPSNGATAVAMTLTATNAQAAGFVTVWPSGTRPTVSNLNLPAAGATVPNLVVVPLGADGSIRLFSQTGTDLVVDVVGWFTDDTAPQSSDGLFVPLAPARALDTRQNGQPLTARLRRDLAYTATNPALSGASAIVTNLTIAESAAPLYLTAYPAQTSRPLASNLNADRSGATRANLALVPVTAGARASFYANASTQLVSDVAGYFVGSPLPFDQNVAVQAATPAGSATSLPAFDTVIDQFIAAYGLTGAQVSVASGGRLVYTRAYGTANVFTGAPVTIDSRFRLASQSKLLVGAAIMQLVEAGRLSLDQPALPLVAGRLSIGSGLDPRIRAITVGELLAHSAGFLTAFDPFFNEDAEVVAAFGPTGTASCPQAASWLLGFPLAYDPGTKSDYANIDYCLLGLVLEKVTGEPYDVAIGHGVLVPRDIVDMRVAGTYDSVPGDVLHVTPAPTVREGGYFMESLGAAGNWLGTSTDMVRFLDGLDPTKPGAHLVSAPTLSAMLAKPGYEPDPDWKGLGLLVWADGSYGHSGALKQARGMTLHRPDGITWSIQVNGTLTKHAERLRATMDAAVATVASWPTGDLSPDVP